MNLPNPETSSRDTGRWLESRDLPPLLQRVRPYTMVPAPSLTELARQVRSVIEQRIPGGLVECGTWRGGASFLMAGLLGAAAENGRRVWMFDSFEGIPPPEPIDGAAAHAWAKDTASPWYHDNLRVSLEDVQQAARSLGLAERTVMVKGYFEKTLPATRGRMGPIALLRIDADWHASVQCCLEHLADLVSPGGLIVLDDYFAYEGCAIAVHEFLGRRSLPHRIEAIGEGPEAPQVVLATGRKTWRWMRETHRLNQDLAHVLPPHGPFVLVDQEQLRVDLEFAPRALPFLEADGQYAGPPADDSAARAGLEAARRRGATHLVLTWPCFWWLDHYPRLISELRTAHAVVLENARAVVFDLRPRQ